jgi:hypothetical protein
MVGDMSIDAGDELHYIAFLDAELKTLQIIPMRQPIEVPLDAKDVSVDVTVRLTLKGTTD